MKRISRGHSERPVLITEAPPNPQAALQYRRRRYALTMGLRVVCLVLAAAFYRHPYVWPAFAVGALVLPWIAVVLANDRLRAKPSRFQRFVGLTSDSPGIEQRQRRERDASTRAVAKWEDRFAAPPSTDETADRGDTSADPDRDPAGRDRREADHRPR